MNHSCAIVPAAVRLCRIAISTFDVPANLPREITTRLHAETMKILAMPDVKKRLEGLAGEPGNLSAGDFAAMAKTDYERSGKLVRDAGIKAEQ